MDHNSSISAITSIIELALAPVFLLTGIGAVLSVLTLRLGRAIDRGRLLDRQIAISAEDDKSKLVYEATAVWRRIRFINWAIRFSVVAALLVCVLIALLFVGDFATFNLGGIIGYLFIATMGMMVLSLSSLLAEVSISTRSLRQGLEHLIQHGS